MKHILWTRPTERNDAFIKALSPDIKPIHCPCYQITLDTPPEIQWASMDQIIVLSRHAIHALPKNLNTPIIAIGPGTQKALKTRGYQSICPDLASSEGLLNLPCLNDVAQSTILILSGHDSHDHLPNMLSTQGALVTTHPTYRRMPHPGLHEALRHLTVPIDGLLATAITPIQFLVKALPSAQHNLFQKPVYCLSPRIRDAIQALGFTRTYTAEAPSPKAMAKCLAQKF